MNNKVLFNEVDALQKQINKLRPFSGKNITQLKEYFKVGLTYSSNALEGNSLTESETKVVLEEGITIGGKSLKDHYEAVGHGEAFEKLFEKYSQKTISEKTIKELHALFYNRIDQAEAGQYRKIQVFISGSKYALPKPKDIQKQMQDFLKKIPSNRKKYHAVHFAALLHKEFVFIHPFIDGNGRLGRLLMNLALLQEGYLLAIIPPILRAEYIRLLELAHENDALFIQFIGEAIRETQRDYLRLFK